MNRRPYLFLLRCLMSGLVILSSGTEILSAQTVNVADPTRVISGEDLRSEGVVRLSDLLHDLSEVRTVALDGFTTRFSLNGISSFVETAPLVFVDGHPISYGLFATGDLNLLGLPVEVIDRIEIYARPSLISGVFAGEGAIHIFTKQAVDMAELHGSAMTAVNDTDAGYLDFEGGKQTQQKFSGPDVEISGVGEAVGGSVLAAAVYRRHTHAERSGGRPLTQVLSPSIIYTLARPRVHLSVAALAAKADRFTFAPYASHALATDHKGAALSAIASHRISDRGILRHRFTVDLNRADFGHNHGPWREGAFFVSTALARTLEERIVVLGGTAGLRRARHEAVSEDVRWASVFAAIAGRMAVGTHYRGGGTVAMDGRSVAVKAYGGITVARWEHHRIDVYIAVVDALLHEQNAADLWAREDLMPPRYPSEVDRPHDDVALRATFDAEWRWQPDAFQELRIGAGIRRSERVFLPSRMLRPAAGGGLRELIDYEYTDGTLGVLWGEYATHILPGRQRLFWNWQHAITGRDTFANAWKAVPDVRLGLSVTTPMISGFRLRGSVERVSPSRWNEFEMVPDVDMNVDASTRVNAWLSKRLFSGRWIASAGVLNVLGEEIRTHPLGDMFGRSVFLDIGFDLVRR